jgi:PAS domain S-box-containing protein
MIMADAQQQEIPHHLPSSPPMQVTTAGLIQSLQISPDALIVVDHAGSIVMVNEQAETLFGYRQQELLHQPLEMLLPKRFRTNHLRQRNRYIVTPQMRPMGVGLRLFGLRKDGLEFPVDVSLRPLLLDEQLLVMAAIRDMTEQHRVERERIQQLQRIRLQDELINQSHDAIFVRDSISRVLTWNRGAEELYGWTEREVLGRISHSFLKTRFPDSRMAVEEALEEEGRWEGELTHTRRDGSTVIVESRQVLVRDEQGRPSAILEINRDVTERHRLRQAEHATHVATAARLAFLQQVLDALPSSVYLVYGHDARLILANRMTVSLWGAPWQTHQPMLEFLSTNGISIFDPQGRPLPPAGFATLRAVQKGETTLHHQETIRRRDGSNLPVLVNAVALISQHLLQAMQEETEQPLPESGPLALVVYQDVTTLKETDYLKDEFVGIAAHELRTPLAVLKGYADMLLVQSERQHGPPLADWQQEALEEIKLATTRLVDLTEELLEVTRLQAGRLILHSTPTNVVSLVQRVADHLQRTTTRHQIEVHTAQPLLVANVDPGRIEQVLVNLIGNAIKYSPQGGPVIVTLKEEIAVRQVLISVQDRGIGIPERQHAQIFGRFIRADNAQAYGITGTGLGLYLSRELVERHGGHLWFESVEGSGSTFFLTLPLVDQEERTDGRPPGPPPPISTPPAPPIHGVRGAPPGGPLCTPRTPKHLPV